jgi:UDP-N-acetylglucosamine acyltransferase
MSGVERDVIPYGAVKGERARLYDINVIGLRRAGVKRQEIMALKKVYERIFFGNDTIAQSVEDVEKSVKGVSCVDRLIKFMKENTDRSFCCPQEKK